MIFFPDQHHGSLADILRWLFSHYIEIFATITGIIYLIYSIQGKVLLWLFGIISSALLAYVFFKSGIYADMCINLYYVVISIYGWYHWSFSKEKVSTDLPISRLNKGLGISLLLISLVLLAGIMFILKRFTDSDIALWDSIITAFSITATWMLARKILEHWLVWIVIDLISVFLYIYKGLYPTVVLFLFYTTLAFVGYIEWKRQWKTQQVPVNA